MTTSDLAPVTGRAAQDDPPPRVLLIHGQPGTSVVWNRVREMLETLGLRVIVVDRPGYGHDSEAATDQFSNATRLSALLDDEETPTVVVGHSLGAGIAAAMAVIAPRQVRALVLVAPAVGASAVTPTDRLLAAPLVGPTLSWLGFRAAGIVLRLPQVRRRVLTVRAGLSPTQARDVVAHLTGGHTWRTFTIEQRHFVAEAHGVRRNIGDITCPVVIVAGVRDRLVRPKVVSDLAKQLPTARVTKVDAGHLIPLDHPRSVVRAVLDVLAWEYRMSLAAQPRTRRRN
jgi:pimeloyl-ACP methyl ester carboxylesterase